MIDNTSAWYHTVHPEGLVPALKDQDPDTKKDFTVFESTACVQHLAGRFDTQGLWTGKTIAEKAQVITWTAYQTSAMGYAV